MAICFVNNSLKHFVNTESSERHPHLTFCQHEELKKSRCEGQERQFANKILLVTDDFNRKIVSLAVARSALWLYNFKLLVYIVNFKWTGPAGTPWQYWPDRSLTLTTDTGQSTLCLVYNLSFYHGAFSESHISYQPPDYLILTKMRLQITTALSGGDTFSRTLV